MRGFLLSAVLSMLIAVPVSAQNWVTYRPSGSVEEVSRIEAREGALPENVSDALDVLSPHAADVWLNISPNGMWMVLETERWGCSGWACLARVRSDYAEGGLITTGGQAIHPEGFSAVSSDGNTVVWPGQGCGSHARDLWISVYAGGEWQTSCLTGDVTTDWNEQPAISDDGASVLFMCGDNICSIGVDGNNLAVQIRLTDHPGDTDWTQLRSPDFDPEGNIVFEGEDDTEMVWRQDHLSCNCELINPSYTNDNSPCVLPDGGIASLWLNRPDNPEGNHEIKLMDGDGGSSFMLVTNPVDVHDVGIGCGGPGFKVFSDGFETGDFSMWTAGGRETSAAFLGCWRRSLPPLS